MRIRAARTDDYETFARLFLELESGDPVPERSQFAEEIAPGTLVAEDAGALGYAYGHLHDGVLHVRHLVTAPDARRRGVGRALLRAVRARATGAHTWCLNVKRGNTAALALYESEGLAIAWASSAFRFGGDALAGIALPATLRLRALERPEEDDAVERAVGLRAGQLALGRARKREPLALEDGVALGGAAVLDARFPGAFPFRLARTELAGPFVRLLADRAARDHLFVTAEDQPDVAAALAAAGGALRFELFHMRGELR